MKTTVRLSLTLLALGLLAAAPITRAADEPSPAPKYQKGEKGEKGKRAGGIAKQRMNDIDAAVGLSADQKEKVTAIWAKEAAAMKEIPAGERRGKAVDAMKSTRDQVRAVLTPEQQAKFDAMPAPARGRKDK